MEFSNSAECNFTKLEQIYHVTKMETEHFLKKESDIGTPLVHTHIHTQIFPCYACYLFLGGRPFFKILHEKYF